MFPSVNEQMDIIRRGVVDLLPEDELVKKLERSYKEKSPLVIKLGCDPSRPDLHLGHTVVLRKMRQFQDLGHQAILIVGDFTGMIGDPSGKSATRPALTLEETRENGRSYFEQASKVLDSERVKIVYNSEWLGKMNFEDVIRLASKYTVARMLERDEFENRYKKGEAISVHEFLYPLAQAMDSVAIKSDVELGGTDQKFNLLVGRDIQREYEQEPQVILTMPILPGTDGVQKMSKSLDNYIGVSESAKEIYGKTLSIDDKLMLPYFELATSIPNPFLDGIRRAMGVIHQANDNVRRAIGVVHQANDNVRQTMGVVHQANDNVRQAMGVIHQANDNVRQTVRREQEEEEKIEQQRIEAEKLARDPRNLKRRLARELVALYHSQEEAVQAEEEFDRIFIKKDIPDDIEEFTPETDEAAIWIVKLMTESGMTPSNGEGRRMVKQGAVSIDGDKVSDPNMEVALDAPFVLKVGKRRFKKIVPKNGK